MLLLLCAIGYVVLYTPSVIDPIESVKLAYIGWQFLAILVILVLLGLVAFLSKDKKQLMRNLKAVLILSLIALVAFIGIKLFLDNIFTDEKFGELYDTGEYKVEGILNKIGIDSDGITLERLTPRQIFVNENVKIYNYFTTKIIIGILIYVAAMGLNIFMLLKAKKASDKMDRLAQDDIVIYDDEENVKM